MSFFGFGGGGQNGKEMADEEVKRHVLEPHLQHHADGLLRMRRAQGRTGKDVEEVGLLSGREYTWVLEEEVSLQRRKNKEEAAAKRPNKKKKTNDVIELDSDSDLDSDYEEEEEEPGTPNLRGVAAKGGDKDSDVESPQEKKARAIKYPIIHGEDSPIWVVPKKSSEKTRLFKFGGSLYDARNGTSAEKMVGAATTTAYSVRGQVVTRTDFQAVQRADGTEENECKPKVEFQVGFIKGDGKALMDLFCATLSRLYPSGWKTANELTTVYELFIAAYLLKYYPAKYWHTVPKRHGGKPKFRAAEISPGVFVPAHPTKDEYDASILG